MTFNLPIAPKALLFSAGILSASLLSVCSLPTVAMAQDTGEPLPEPGSFACDNNPNPVCENPGRTVSEGWASENNPGPEYSEPPRLGVPLEPGSWACDNNQNAASCENPIRYTVEDPETWPERFPPAGQRTFGGS